MTAPRSPGGAPGGASESLPAERAVRRSGLERRRCCSNSRPREDRGGYENEEAGGSGGAGGRPPRCEGSGRRSHLEKPAPTPARPPHPPTFPSHFPPPNRPPRRGPGRPALPLADQDVADDAVPFEPRDGASRDGHGDDGGVDPL